MATAQTINNDCLSGLKGLKETNLLKLTDPIADESLCSSWKGVEFDADGYVTLLDFGGKRLYKGLPCSVDIFEQFSRLSKLNLAGTDLPLSDIILILEKVSKQIECLYVGGNGIRQEGGQAIGGWLPSATKLKKLDLRYNDLGGEGMETLCDGLKDTNVEHLYAEGNQIGDQGAIAISKLLKSPNSSLREVFLGGNNVQAKGAIEVALSLQSNMTVSKIYLEGNSIGLEGANAFSNVLEELDGNTSLKNLFVDNNNIGKEGSKRLAKALNSATVIGDSLLE